MVVETEAFESRSLFEKAQNCIRRNEYEQASVLIAQALKIEPGNAVYMSHMGHCVAMLGNVDEGERICQSVIERSPPTPILLVNLGRVYRAQGRRREARQAFEQAYKIDGTNAAAALELSSMGVRRVPMLGFLHRDHAVNIFLGKLRHKIVMRLREPKWKKL
jgi:predicted Zn-dependent protease